MKVRRLLLLLLLLFPLVELGGCRAADGSLRVPIISDVIDGLTGKEARSDPRQGRARTGEATQSDVAWYVTGSLRWGSGILVASGVVIGLLGNWPRAMVSFGVAIGLMVINGILLTLLKSTTAVWALAAATMAVIVTFLYLDMRDGVAFWQRKEHFNVTLDKIEERVK